MEILSQKELERISGRIKSEMGRPMCEALLDPDTIEIMLNPDGKVWQEKLGGEPEHICDLSSVDALTLFNTIAHSLGEKVNRKNPILEGRLIVNGSRFEGLIPPVVDGPTFAIRNQATSVFTLQSYLDNSSLTERQFQALENAIRERKNILVVGSTGSGKTTFCNALLDSISKIYPTDRIVSMEDTRELQINVVNHVSLYTSIDTTMRDLLKATMRLRPDKIIVGETRGGEALDLIKAWNTGHSGGLSTVHANSALAGLTRIEDLCAESTDKKVHKLIAESINISVFIHKTSEGRKIKEILKVTGYNEATNSYEVESL